MNIQRGWMVTSENGTILKQCSNCEKFTQCEKNPKWNFKVCKDYETLSSEQKEDK